MWRMDTYSLAEVSSKKGYRKHGERGFFHTVQPVMVGGMK
jgi:hypothetical protein